MAQRSRPSAEETITIGELSRRTRVSTRTIRYYEEIGILPPPGRSDGGTRRYPRDYVFYVEGARVLKQIGFSLEEIAELGRWALTGATASRRTQVMLKEKLAELEHRIRVLNRLHDLVADAAAGSRTKRPAVPALLKWLSENGQEAVLAEPAAATVRPRSRNGSKSTAST